MQFSEAQIQLASQMKEAGLAWQPKVGHYVFDRGKVCKRGSPFQERVYFILDYECFCRHVGGADVLAHEMVWLPTWYDCREVLRQGGVTDLEVIEIVSTAIRDGNELTELYKKILSVPACLKEFDAKVR
tara:strand:+ start:206 stop:592 length:387 start_codon:yes stop_codon:yes gene_type:complete